MPYLEPDGDFSTQTNQESLEGLVQALQEFTSRLAPLAALVNHNNASLRIAGISMPTVTVSITGTLGGVTTLTNFGTSQPAYIVGVAQTNLAAILGNINNTTGV